MQPLVSVIIPVYNRLAFLDDAIRSVLAQSYQRYEIIVVDDGSSVDVQGRLRPYSGSVIFVSKENGGLASARNAGARQAGGEFLAFLDDDDLFLPEKLERQVAVMLEHPEVALVYSDEYLVDRAGSMTQSPLRGERRSPLPSGFIARDFLMESFIGVMTVLVRRRVFDEMGGFDESLRYNEDDDLWFRIMLKYPAACSQYVSGARRLHDSNMSRDRTAMTYYQLRCLRQYLQEYPSFMQANREGVRRRIRSLLLCYLKTSIRGRQLPSPKVLALTIGLSRDLARLMR